MLEFIGLQKRYGDVVALDGCSFSVRPGRLVGFLGPNGSGKTTAMRSIFNLVRLDSGEVRWNGEAPGPAERSSFGYMPESRGLYPRMGARDQIVYFARLHGMAAAEAGAAADNWLERLGLEGRAAGHVAELSHGNQQRVQLAVALVHQPPLAVLDEPFSGLDPLGVAQLGEVVRREAERGAAVLFSSHQLDLVEDLCDDIAVIHRGRIVLHGALDVIRATSPYRYVEVSVATDADWWPPIARDGVEVLSQRGREVRLRVPAAANPATLLAAAEGAGAVQHFRFEPPSLSDLFIEAVRE